EDDRDVQPRVLDREPLHGVVLVGPVQARVAGAARAGRVDRDVGSTGQYRADVVVDEDLLLTNRVRQIEAALARAGVAGVGALVLLVLALLAVLPRRGLPSRGVAAAFFAGAMLVQVRRLPTG